MPDAGEINYDALGLTPPTSTSHNVGPDDIRSKLVHSNPRNWRLMGNELTADTDFGELVQTVPTNVILTGTDENGLPVFKKIG